jgi:hypothetical protein
MEAKSMKIYCRSNLIAALVLLASGALFLAKSGDAKQKIKKIPAQKKTMEITPTYNQINSKSTAVQILGLDGTAVPRIAVWITLPGPFKENMVNYDDTSVSIVDTNGQRFLLPQFDSSVTVYCAFLGAGPPTALGTYALTEDQLTSIATIEVTWKGSTGTFSVTY